MGRDKDHIINREELGISADRSDSSICEQCICDSGLAEFIRANATGNECSYCERTDDNLVACEIDLVVERMAEFIGREWTDPAEELPWDGQEGGYQGETMEGMDLLDTVGFRPDNNQVFEDVVSYFAEHDWCRTDYFALTSSERQQVGWQKFCTEVKHLRRYTFWTSLDDDQSEYHPDYLPPGLMMHTLGEAIGDGDLIRAYPTGTLFWRVREHEKGRNLSSPLDFSSPPREKALQANRMSPAGISMFYGADDFETAAKEVASIPPQSGRQATGGAFQSTRPFWLLDLAADLPRRSYFTDGGHDWTELCSFLRYFSADLSKPIYPDRQQHIEYIPTQVFTEYVRFNVRGPNNVVVDGIRYPSSRNGRPCVVLFFEQNDFSPFAEKKALLEFVPLSLRTVDLT